MTRRTFSVLGLAATLAIVIAAAPAVSTQGTSSPTAPPLVITAYNGGAPIPYTTPKTPWGEPDLQGVWSSDDMDGIPRPRPAAMGSRLYQNDQEYAARVKTIQQSVNNRENNATSTLRNDFARRAFRQTSQIVDPPDAQQPAFTPAAEKRRAPRDRGTFGDGRSEERRVGKERRSERVPREYRTEARAEERPEQQ